MFTIFQNQLFYIQQPEQQKPVNEIGHMYCSHKQECLLFIGPCKN